MFTSTTSTISNLTTLSQVKSHVWVGNAHSDLSAFMAIDKLVQDTTVTIEDRAESLRIMSDKGMGCGRDEQITDADLVQNYLDSM